MKTITLVLFLLVSTIGFSQFESKKVVKDFCNDFASSIKNGDLKNALTFMEKDYVQTQHDGMLEGRTDQFFSELLAGWDKKDVFIAPELKEIKTFKITKIAILEDSYAKISFKITLKNGTVISNWLHLYSQPDGSMTFVGPLG